MALGDSYVTATSLKAHLGIEDTKDDILLTAVAMAATERVNQFCQRQFNQTTTSTDRTYEPRDCRTVEVDDFHTTTGLVIKTDTGDDGGFATTWTTGDYVLEPFGGVVAGETGWPYQKIVAVEDLHFLARTGRPRVQVTAQWGWAAVPASVTLATKLIAAQLFNLKDAVLGVANFGEAGIIRVRDVPQAAMLLEKYQHSASTGPLVA